MDVMVLFGSGGHSAEMLSLVKSSGIKRKIATDAIDRLICVISEDDTIIEKKINEEFNSTKLDIVRLRRARRVGQSYVTSVFTTLLGFWFSLILIFQSRPAICLSNGPAIGFTVGLAMRLLQVATMTLFCRSEFIYVESFCRTKSLSLTGKLIYHLRIANQFYVQWPKLVTLYPRALYKGILV